jgi:hypothetical protein
MESITSFVTSNNQQSEMDYDDSNMDSYSGFSDSEKLANYMELVNTVKFFESSGRITEDWMEKNKWLIEKWRDWIGDYSQLHLDITDKAFRKACNEVEMIMQYLVHSIRTTKTFDTKMYCILVNKLKYICDNMFEDGELENLMSKIGLQ